MKTANAKAITPANAMLTVSLEPTALARALVDALGDDRARKLVGQVHYRIAKGFRRRDLPGQRLLFPDLEHTATTPPPTERIQT